MGLPKNTCSDAILCDIAVMKQSIRFKFERLKLGAKIGFDLCPRPVQTQVVAYKKTSRKTIKYFRGKSIRQVVTDRSDYLRSFPKSVIVPKRETFHQYSRSLNRNKPRPRLVYSTASKTNPFRADLAVKTHPIISMPP